MHELIETAAHNCQATKVFTATGFATDCRPGRSANSRAVESVRVNGKPRLKHIAFIASYEPGTLKQFSTSVVFWRRARTRLDRLGNRITPEDRARRSRRRSRVGCR